MWCKPAVVVSAGKTKMVYGVAKTCQGLVDSWRAYDIVDAISVSPCTNASCTADRDAFVE